MDQKPKQPANLVNGIPQQDLDAWLKANGPIPEHPESSRPRDSAPSTWLDIDALFR
jgi:hypothetical protein